jgi:transcriptional regulator with XRE-family HTH domain
MCPVEEIVGAELQLMHLCANKIVLKPLNAILLVQMPKRQYAYPPTVHEAAELLGAEIAQARLARRWTVRELAERAGVSPATLQKVERGNPSVALGTAFDVATLVGVPLFYADDSRLADEAARLRRPTLLPRAVRHPRGELDNEF